MVQHVVIVDTVDLGHTPSLSEAARRSYASFQLRWRKQHAS